MNALLTRRQVAELLGVHANTVGRWVQSGELPAYRLGSRGDLRFDPEAVDAFVKSGRVRRKPAQSA